MPLHHRLLLAASPLLLLGACATTSDADSTPTYQAPEVMTGSRVPHGSGSQPTQSASGESVRNAGGIAPATLPRTMGTDR